MEVVAEPPSPPPPPPVDVPPAEPAPLREIGQQPFQAAGDIYGAAVNPGGTRLAWWCPLRAGAWSLPDGHALPGMTVHRSDLEVRGGAWLDDERLALLVSTHDLSKPGRPNEVTWVDKAVTWVDIVGPDGDPGQAGIPSTRILPSGSEAHSMARSTDGRWLGCACGMPAGEPRRRPGAGLDEPVFGHVTGVALIDATTGAVSERIGPLADAGDSAAVVGLALSTDMVAVVVGGITDNLATSRTGRIRTAADVVVWDRRAERVCCTVRLPWRSFQVDAVQWHGPLLRVLATHGKEPVTGWIDPGTGDLRQDPGWTVDRDGQEVARLDAAGLQLLTGQAAGRVQAIGDVRDVTWFGSSRRQVLLAQRWHVQATDLDDGREVAPLGSGFPSRPDDLGWLGDRLLGMCGDRLVASGPDGTRPWLSDGRFGQWNPLAIGGDRVAMGMGYRNIRLLDGSAGTVLATLTRSGATPEQCALAPDGSRLLVLWLGSGAVPFAGIYDSRDGHLGAVLDPAQDAAAAGDGSGDVRSVRCAWSTDAGTLGIGTGRGGDARLAGCWDATSGALKWRPRDPDAGSSRAATDVVPIGQDLVLARFAGTRDEAGSAVLLAATDGHVVRSISDPGACPVPTADGSRVAGTVGVVALAPGMHDETWAATNGIFEREPSGAWRWSARSWDGTQPAEGIVVSPGGGWMVRLVGAEAVICDTAGAGLVIHRQAHPPCGPDIHPVQVAWHPGEDRFVITWSDRATAIEVPLFAPATGVPDPDAARRQLDGPAWPSAVGRLVASGDAGFAAIRSRPVDGRQILVWELLAAGGHAGATAALQAEAQGPASVLASLARDAQARLTARHPVLRHPALPQAELPLRPPGPEERPTPANF